MYGNYKISDHFKVQFTRPLNNLSAVSIAELAQFTTFYSDGRFILADAVETLHREWAYETDTDHELNHLDFDEAVVWFKDGSSLSFQVG